ncbi:AbiU2 domain-containing protein [Sphingobacterium suaedae]|uniref:HEPN AbiU2-like domain-containing protein n=1 Tax=Sphingobacterium suaedae TaxID=1686402 RepID=A0ABW5KIE0_9SPHI
MENVKYPYMNHVQMTLHLMFHSLTELRILSKPRTSRSELKLLNSHLFTFYAVSVQYMFTMEFCKLLETSNKAEENVASLMKLNEYTLKEVGQQFNERYQENRHILNEIRKSDIHKLIRKNRNTKFGHLDGSQSQPYRISPLSDDELDDVIGIVEKVKKVFNNCTSVYDFEFMFTHEDDRTDNFVKFHARYQEFYSQNRRLAMEQGFF